MSDTKVKSLLFVGDTVPNVFFTFGDRFKSFCKQHSLRIFNLEGSFSIQQNPLFKAGPHLLLEDKIFIPLTECFNVAVIANNHAMDYGTEGLQTTLDLCHRNGIKTVGAGINIGEAFRPLDINNCRIIAVAENEFGSANENTPGIATTDNEREIFYKIREGRQNGQFVVVVAHGGTEIIPIPPPYLRERYRLWVEYGANLVISNHPHVVQGHEIYQGACIFYSLGNFAFFNDSFKEYPNARWSIMVSIDLESKQINIIPVAPDKHNCIEIQTDIKIMNEYNRLCGLIASPDYPALYQKIAENLYQNWYKRLAATSKEDAALLLHYLRCDAHRNAIQKALSHTIGEEEMNPLKEYEIKTSETIKDIFDIVKKHNTSITINFEQVALQMQMFPEERDYICHILKIHKNFLEIGCGYSTIWFSQFAEQIVSVETRTDWFLKIKQIINDYQIDNVELCLFPPELCAYSNGQEKWNNRNLPQGSDYGLPEEFVSYLANIEKLIEDRDFDLVLVDGNVRKEVVEILIHKKFKGVILLYDVMPERAYLNDPIFNLEGVKVIHQVRTLVELGVPPYKLEVGGYIHIPGWITTNKETLDITKKEDWKKVFMPYSIKAMFAEHVLEHLYPEQVKVFFESVYDYLIDGAYIRIAVPDALHPSQWYHDLCKPGGSDIGSDDHKYFFSCKNIYDFFNPNQFEIRLLEWWDEEGFHKVEWNNDDIHGKINRSSQIYDGRITTSKELQELLYQTTPDNMRSYYAQYKITYTSLIFDLLKKDTIDLLQKSISIQLLSNKIKGQISVLKEV